MPSFHSFLFQLFSLHLLTTTSLYNSCRCCCCSIFMRCHTSHRCLFLRISTAHIDTAFSIAYNRIRYISIFMYDMLKFPISVLVVFALSARTLSFHLQRLSSSLSARGSFFFFFCCCTMLRFILQQQVLQHKMLISTHVFFPVILSFFGLVLLLSFAKWSSSRLMIFLLSFSLCCWLIVLATGTKHINKAAFQAINARPKKLLSRRTIPAWCRALDSNYALLWTISIFCNCFCVQTFDIVALRFSK